MTEACTSLAAADGTQPLSAGPVEPTRHGLLTHSELCVESLKHSYVPNEFKPESGYSQT